MGVAAIVAVSRELQLDGWESSGKGSIAQSDRELAELPALRAVKPAQLPTVVETEIHVTAGHISKTQSGAFEIMAVLRVGRGFVVPHTAVGEERRDLHLICEALKKISHQTEWR